jgi:hypothetical protein
LRLRDWRMSLPFLPVPFWLGAGGIVGMQRALVVVVVLDAIQSVSGTHEVHINSVGLCYNRPPGRSTSR